MTRPWVFWESIAEEYVDAHPRGMSMGAVAACRPIRISEIAELLQAAYHAGRTDEAKLWKDRVEEVINSRLTGDSEGILRKWRKPGPKGKVRC